jgi:hypothetical protein
MKLITPLLFGLATAAPWEIAQVDKRTPLTPAFCSGLNLVVDVLKLHKATSFCSSYLAIQTKTSTVVVPKTTTITTATFTSTESFIASSIFIQ